MKKNLITRSAGVAFAIVTGITFVGAGVASATAAPKPKAAQASTVASAASLRTQCRVRHNRPCISAVTFTGSNASPTITISGSGFGHGPGGLAVAAGCGASGSDFTKNSLWIEDGWHAGQATDCIGLFVSSYSPTQIVFTLGNWYNSSNSSSSLNSSDTYTVGVERTTHSGTVSYSG